MYTYVHIHIVLKGLYRVTLRYIGFLFGDILRTLGYIHVLYIYIYAYLCFRRGMYGVVHADIQALYALEFGI